MFSEFRKNFLQNRKPSKRRIVPAFSVQTLQKDTSVRPPPKCKPLRNLTLRHHQFRENYDQGNLPVILDSGETRLLWKVNIEKFNFHHYLPIFFDGLCETRNPYKFLAQQGIHYILSNGSAEKILPCIPQLVIPIKNAFYTKNESIMCSTLRVLQHLVRCGEGIGEALVPYYRQILPVLNMYKEKNVNCGDGIDYSQMRGENLADVINETLEVLEKYGKENAFINIKYLIPTYESCLIN